MKSRIKRGLVLVLSGLLFAASFSGCRYEVKKNVQRIERRPRSEYTQDYNYDFYSRDKLEIDIMAPFDDSKFSETENLIPQIEEATNTKLNVTFVPEDSFANRVLTSLSGNDTPELICRAPSRQALIRDGAAYPLYDILMQYAPDYMDLVESYEDEDMLLELTDVETFEIYSMMNIRQPECQLSFLIRQDWLDNLGLDAPETWDEFVDVLTAFRDEDPNGNGKKDEIPFSVQDITNLRYAFGIDTRYYFAMDGDEYVPTVYHSQYRNYLESLQELYASGLLDNSYYTRGYEGLEIIMGDNTLGCTVYYSEYAKISTEDLQKNSYTTGVWVGIPPIQGPNGDAGIQSAGGFEHNFMISSKVSKEKAIEIVRFMNWFYTEEGINLLNYGVDGVHNVVGEDGSRTLKPEYASFASARKAGMLFEPFNFYFTYDAYLQCVTNGKPVSEITGTDKLFFDALGINADLTPKYNFVKNCVCLYTSEWNENSTTLEKNMNQFEERAITGLYYGSKLTAELESIQKEYKKAYEEGQAAYAELKTQN